MSQTVNSANSSIFNDDEISQIYEYESKYVL